MSNSEFFSKINHHQILIPLGFLIIGIFAQKFFNLNIYILLTLQALLLISIIWLKNSPRAIKIILFSTFFLSGAILLWAKTYEFKDLRKKISNRPLELKCEVLENRPTKNNIWKEAIKFRAYESRTNSSFDFLCFCSLPSELKMGDQIYLEGLTLNFKEKSNKNNQGLDKPNFDDYLIKEGVIGSCFSRRLNYRKIENESYFSNFITTRKKNLLSRLEGKLNKSSYALFSLMFLGNKGVLVDPALKDKFSFWGLLHYLARSGLHVVVFILFWRFFLSFIPMLFRFKQIFLILLSIIYALLSFPSVSFSRAFLVFILYEVGKLLEMQVIFLYLLSLVCFFMVLTNPLIVLFLDFQLSFGLTFALSILSSNLKAKD